MVKGVEVTLGDGATGVEVFLDVGTSPGRVAMSADDARELGRQLSAAAAATDKLNSERILRRHRRQQRFEV